jgi:hypothetical protein
MDHGLPSYLLGIELSLVCRADSQAPQGRLVTGSRGRELTGLRRLLAGSPIPEPTHGSEPALWDPALWMSQGCVDIKV